MEMTTEKFNEYKQEAFEAVESCGRRSEKGQEALRSLYWYAGALGVFDGAKSKGLPVDKWEDELNSLIPHNIYGVYGTSYEEFLTSIKFYYLLNEDLANLYKNEADIDNFGNAVYEDGVNAGIKYAEELLTGCKGIRDTDTGTDFADSMDIPDNAETPFD